MLKWLVWQEAIFLNDFPYEMVRGVRLEYCYPYDMVRDQVRWRLGENTEWCLRKAASLIWFCLWQKSALKTPKRVIHTMIYGRVSDLVRIIKRHQGLLLRARRVPLHDDIIHTLYWFESCVKMIWRWYSKRRSMVCSMIHRYRFSTLFCIYIDISVLMPQLHNSCNVGSELALDSFERGECCRR